VDAHLPCQGSKYGVFYHQSCVEYYNKKYCRLIDTPTKNGVVLLTLSVTYESHTTSSRILVVIWGFGGQLARVVAFNTDCGVNVGAHNVEVEQEITRRETKAAHRGHEHA
jgi:hypothetical protein